MNSIKKLFLAAALAALQVAPGAAWAQGTSPAAAAEMTEAEVRKVDKEQGKLTLKHGPIKSLDMPGMTMVFAVKDKAMLDKLKAGDKLRFKATQEGGKYTVVEIAPAN